MSNGFSIDTLRGTPLYALAQNANVNGGGTLDAAEMFAFQQQMQNMGWTPEQFGLAIEVTDNAGETAKETRKNMQQAGKDLEKSYKTQFGKQGAEAAQTAEQRADAMVKTAYDMFKYEHGNVMFIPKSLGARPKYTNAQYMDDVSRYSADLMNWANDVKQEYINATKMTNAELAALIINNDNNNARDIMINDNINAGQLSDKIDDSTKQINKNVDSEGAATRATVRQEGAKTRANDDANAVGLHAHMAYEGAYTRSTVEEQGYKTRETVRNESDYTRYTVKKESEDIKDTVKSETKETEELNASSQRIQTNLNANATSTHTIGTLDKMGSMQEKIIQSNLPHEEKMALMNKLEQLSIKVIIRDGDMDALNKEIDQTINQ